MPPCNLPVPDGQLHVHLVVIIIVDAGELYRLKYTIT